MSSLYKLIKALNGKIDVLEACFEWKIPPPQACGEPWPSPWPSATPTARPGRPSSRPRPSS